MIRVAYCATAPHGGGALNYLVDLVEHHDRSRVESLVFLDWRATGVETALARLARCGVEVRSTRIIGLRGEFLRRGWWARELRACGPFDVASLHQHVPGTGLSFLAGARRAGVPLLVRTEQLPRMPPFESPPWTWNAFVHRVSRARLARLPGVRVAVAEAGRRALVARGEPPDEVHVIPPGYAESAFTDIAPRDEVRARLGIPADAVVVGFLASLNEQKRPDAFLDLAARLRAEGCNATFVIGGSGPLAETVAARVRGFGGGVVAIGERDDVPEVLSAFDVFVLPSLWEGLPITVLEAMRAGACVVATDVDGTGEVVRDGETGRLVPPGDLDALTAAVRSLLSDPAARTRLAAAGTELVRARFEASALARRTEALYEEQLRTRPARR